MKYITNIEINNFQSHKNTNINLENGLNVIVGPSDQGKTAIIRAVKWALYNEPLGTFFIRHKEKEASVTLTFNTGEKIKRLRSDTKNIYVYIDSENNREVYEGFGHSVPIDIKEKINIKKIYLNDKESNAINIGEQLEGPFLISEKNSTRANAIGRLVGVHVVDKAVKNTMKDARNLTIKRKSLKEDIEILEQKLNKYSYLDELESNLIKLETLKDIIQYKQSLLDKLKDINDKYKKYNELITKYKSLLSNLNNLDKLDNLLNELNKYIFNFKILSKLKEKHKNINIDILKNKSILENLEHINISMDLLNNLDIKIIKYNKLLNLNRKYNLLVDNINKSQVLIIKFQDIDYLFSLCEEIKLINNSLTLLNNLKTSYNKVVNSINKGEKYTNKFNDIELVNSIYEKIYEKQKEFSYMQTISKKINKLSIEKRNASLEIKNETHKINILLDKYKTLLKHIEKCPLCFNSITNEDLNKIIENLS